MNDGEIYDLLELVRVFEDGTEEKIELSSDNKYKYNIEAGQKYVFMAKYRPYTVVYHLNIGESKIIIKNHLDVLGDMPNPTYDIGNNGYIFVGWTDDVPENSKYHYFQTYEAYEDSYIKIYKENALVTEALELWPVYVKVQIEVNSNIDNILEQNNIELESVRYVTRPSINQIQINAETVELNNIVLLKNLSELELQMKMEMKQYFYMVKLLLFKMVMNKMMMYLYINY